LRRNGKSFDAKHTTYLMTKLTIDYRIAEKIDIEGRRGDKLAFGHLEICKILISKYLNKNKIKFYFTFNMKYTIY